MTFVIFLPSKKGHYKDYSLFLSLLLKENKVSVASTFWEKLPAIFSNNKYILFLDIDDKDILWACIRAFFSRKSFGISVSAETLLNRNFSLKFYQKENRIQFKNKIKYLLLRILKSFKRLKLISIHKETPYQEKLTKIVSFFTYDFQYYDLRYIKINQQRPPELNDFKVDNRKTVLIVNNTSGEKKNLNELKEWIERSNNFLFIVVGKNDFVSPSTSNENILLITRYVTNEELLFLINFSEIIYCYYSNNRPSGFLGRSMQLRKKILVPDRGYLSTIKYPFSIKVSSLQEVENFKIEYDNTLFFDYSDDKNLLNYLTKTA